MTFFQQVNTHTHTHTHTQPARTCSDRFPVTNYSVNVLDLGSVTIGNSNSSRVAIPVNTTALAGFVQEGQYSLTISACIEITCRESLESTTLCEHIFPLFLLPPLLLLPPPL